MTNLSTVSERRAARAGVLACAALLVAAPLAAQSLRGSLHSMREQNAQAHAHDFTFLATASRVRDFVDRGYLVRVRPNSNFRLHQVSFPYARPEVRTFIERLAGQYRAACGEQLVVTSLTRPTSRQPRNASARSVHPTGMAVDLRYPRNRTCRGWLERTLLDLEKSKVLEATRERYPAHYHVAVYPEPYAEYVEMIGDLTVRVAQRTPEPPARRTSYTVRRGDSLWTIARRYDTTVEVLQEVNHIRGSRIYAGQVLTVPR